MIEIDGLVAVEQRSNHLLILVIERAEEGLNLLGIPVHSADGFSFDCDGYGFLLRNLLHGFVKCDLVVNSQ